MAKASKKKKKRDLHQEQKRPTMAKASKKG